MKAYIVKHYGKKEKLHLTNVADPTINENEVLVQINAAAINLYDTLLKNGDFKIFLPYKTPFVNGSDLAGVITKVGTRVAKFKIGDEVYAKPTDFHIGTFAEYIAVNDTCICYLSFCKVGKEFF